MKSIFKIFSVLAAIVTSANADDRPLSDAQKVVSAVSKSKATLEHFSFSNPVLEKMQFEAFYFIRTSTITAKKQPFPANCAEGAACTGEAVYSYSVDIPEDFKCEGRKEVPLKVNLVDLKNERWIGKGMSLASIRDTVFSISLESDCSIVSVNQKIPGYTYVMVFPTEQIGK